MRSASPLALCLSLVVVLGLSACGQGEAPADRAAPSTPGVDLQNKVLRIGALNDESGPVAVIGRPYAFGKRILAAEINAGGSGLLPEGWKVELIERDHGYNPQRSVQTYNEIREQILFLATSFGTPNTLPLIPMLRRNDMVAYPASAASKLQETRLTPILSASYRMESLRAMDFAVADAGGADQVRAAIVYQHDDYGQDGVEGWLAAARHHGVEVVAKETYTPGQADFTATVTALRRAGATHVMLTTVPSATAPLLGTAAQLGYAPMFIGNSASWIDRFFDPGVVPSSVFARYWNVSAQRIWGEDIPVMRRFLAAYEKYGKGKVAPDGYIFASYVQGMIAVEVFRRALEAGAPTRAGYLQALQTLHDYTAEGALIEPVDFRQEPYRTSSMTRVLKPDFEARKWQVITDYAVPQTLQQ
jgi:ABC-type branched-subunit amino acid transport system substrate-binding protein